MLSLQLKGGAMPLNITTWQRGFLVDHQTEEALKQMVFLTFVLGGMKKKREYFVMNVMKSYCITLFSCRMT